MLKVELHTHTADDPVDRIPHTTGQLIGKTLEESLGEDASRMIADVEKMLGVALDETTAVHVTMTTGTGVAYVSIVNDVGDSQFLPATPR